MQNILIMASKIQECPHIIFALLRMGYSAALYPVRIEDLQDNEEKKEALRRFLAKNKIDLVLSNVFAPFIAQMTYELEIKNAVWCMDSPAFPTYTKEAGYENCYLFYFDRKEYEQRKAEGRSNVYHQPLAGDVEWGGRLVITDEELRKFSCDMSFVGGMYTRNVYDNTIQEYSAQYQEAFSQLIEQAAFLWDGGGQDRLKVPAELVNEVWRTCPGVFDKPYEMTAEYFLRTLMMGQKLTNVERTLLMELLSERYDIHLYTRETEKVPEGVRRFSEIDGGSDAFKVFYSSKINLNITLRSILSGIPARVFDAMSVGGFMLSNWQEEIPELFVEDKEIVTYKTPEELVDKADYYLKHESQRQRIAMNGYQKVKRCYTYDKQLQKLLDKIK